MQDDPYDLSHVIPVAAAPPPVPELGVFEAFTRGVSSAYNQATSVDGDYGFAADLADAFNANDAKIARLLPGYKPNNNADLAEINVYASQFTDRPLPAYLLSDADRQAALKKFEKYTAQLDQLREQFPGQIASAKEIFDRVKADRERYLAESGEIAQSGGVVGAVGGFLGTLGGAFDLYRNPFQFGALFVGGAGKTVATRIITEGAAFAGAEVARDNLFVNPTRQAFGEEEVDVVQNALYAAGLGVAGRGVIEGVGPAFRALEGKVAPGRALARALEADVKAFEPSATSFNLETPTGRAARAIFDHDVALREASPYGNSDAQIARFLRELNEVDEAFSSGDSVVNQVPREPADIRSAARERELLETEAPEVFARLVEAETKLDGLSQNSDSLAASIDNRGIGDIAATFLDKDTADLIASLENDLNDVKAPKARRDAAERQLNTIVETIGPDRFIQAANDSAIKPRYELRAARKREKAARAEFNTVAREAFAEIDRIKARQEAKALAEHTVVVEKAQELTPTTERPTISLTSEIAEASVTQAEKMVQEILKIVDREIQKIKQAIAETAPSTKIITSELIARATINGEVDLKIVGQILKEAANNGIKNGDQVVLTIDGKKINIVKEDLIDAKGQKWGTLPFIFPKPGEENSLEIFAKAKNTYELPNGEIIDLDLVIDLDDGAKSVREILNDLNEDDKLLSAMGSCLI